MGYKKPRCKCGKMLVLETEVIARHTLTSKGSIHKTIDWDKVEWLVCRTCRKTFDANKDDQSRFVRGDEL